MAIDDKITDEKLEYALTGKLPKYQLYHQVRLINMNILQAKKYYLPIKAEYKKKLSLLILL